MNLPARFYFTLFITLLFFSSLSAAAPNNKTAENTNIKVMLKWNHQFQFAGFYAAQKKGFYEENNLSITLKSWNQKDQVQNVLNGEADIALSSSLILVDYIKKQPIQLLFASFQYSPLIFISHDPIKEISELKNKTIIFQNDFESLSILKKTNQKLDNFDLIPTSKNYLSEFMDYQADIMVAYETNEPFVLQQKGFYYYTLDPKSYGVQAYTDIVFTSKKLAKRQPKALEAFKQATIKGWQYALDHPEEIVDYIMNNYQTNKSKTELLNEAQKTAKYIKTNNTPIGELRLNKLKSAANQMERLELFSAQELRNTPFKNLIFTVKEMNLTANEIKYLKDNPVIKIGNDTGWAPFEYINDEAEYTGFAADYIKLIEQKLNIKFDFLKDTPWNEVLNKIKQNNLNMLSCASITEERKKYLNFTKPYLSFTNVLLAKNDKIYITNFNKLNNKKIAAIQGSAIQEHLENKFPKIKLLLVNSVKEGIKAVLDGQVHSYIDNIAVIHHGLKKYNINNLKIIGQADITFDLAIGVAKNDIILLNIMQKALNSITEDEKNTIYNKWFTMQVVTEVDRQQIFTLTIWFLLIAIILSAIIVYLYLEREKRKTYIRQINEFNCMTVSDEQQNLVWVSDCFCKLVGLSKKELLGKSEWRVYAASSQIEKQNELKVALKNMRPWVGELKGYHTNGEVFWTKETRTPEKHKSGIRIATNREIITKHKLLEELSIIDEMTGLYNRRYFNKILPKEIDRRKRDNKPLAIATIDIDYFKKVNDTYGHQVGDEVLKKVAKAFNMYFIRAEDFVFRIGGEEFFIIANFDHEKDFFDYLEQVRNYIEELKIENKYSEFGVVTISTGAYFVDPQKVDDPEFIYQTADKALYAAKHNGRNQTHLSKTTKQLNIPLS